VGPAARQLAEDLLNSRAEATDLIASISGIRPVSLAIAAPHGVFQSPTGVCIQPSLIDKPSHSNIYFRICLRAMH
jgi:hypothetical protein